MRFPHYQQLDSMDCGPTCLQIIADFYGKHFSLSDLRERCYITREGVSLLGISEAAQTMGFRCIGVKLSWNQFLEYANMPCIVHWNQKHFVVVYKIKKNCVYVSDPAQGLLKYTKEQFCNSWIQIFESGNDPMGAVLLLETTPKFYEEEDGNQKRSFSYILKYLKGYKHSIGQIFLAMLTSSIIGLILPFLTQSVVDVGISNSNINFIIMILVAQVILAMGQLANSLIMNWLMLHMTTRISIAIVSDFLSKLMKLPIAFFDGKKLGDIMQRIGDTTRIQTFLTSSLMSIVMSIVIFVIYGIIMGGYSLSILGVFLIGSILYILWVLVFLKRRRRLDYMRFQEASANQSSIVQLVTGMQDIKLNACEQQKRWEWENIQAKLYNVSIKGLALGQAQQVGGTFIDQAKNILISFMAASAVIEGSMTIGMMMAMQYVIGQLNAPISNFISFVQETQDATISMDRLNEIYSKEDEVSDNQNTINEIPEDADIELKDIVFQYGGPHSEKVLDGINLLIPKNKVTAIVGVSGSGKTTLLKLLLGFYNPVSGSVLLNKTPLNRYNIRSWRKKCAAVMQDSFIFSDSVSANIAIADESPNKGRIVEAASLANIDEFISSMPSGYNTKIGAEGNGISTGQKQRILIARAAYKDAKYMLFDEATNSLDAHNEKFIMENLYKFFENKTTVIVAHRLSTVKNADNIVVLERGKIVEQGHHNLLVSKRGAYYNLIKNQLELGN